MIKATLKSLLSRKLRLVLSALAVVLGVMFVSGAFVLTDSLGKSFDSLFASATEGVDVQVAPKQDALAADNGLQSTATVPASVLTEVQGMQDVVEKATGTIYVEGAAVIGKNGKAITSFGPPTSGANWTGTSDLVQLRDGAGPMEPDQVAVNGNLAKTSGYGVGDQISVIMPIDSARHTYKISGIFGYSGDRESLGGELTVAFTTPVAQEMLLGKPDTFSAVEIKAKEGVSQNAARAAIATKVGPSYDVKTGKQLAKDQANQVKEGLKFFNYILLGFAGVALFVGIFLILNTFSIIVAQRTRELALMRAIGASRGQMVVSVLVEALIIGLIASVLGLLAGIGIGALLARIFGSVGGANLPMKGVSVPLSAVIAAFGVGLVITLLAALIPAFRSSRIPPIAAMRDAANTDRPLRNLTVSGAAVLALGATLLGLSLTNRISGNGALWGLLGGVLISFIGVALLTPAISRPVVSALGKLLSWSIPGKLGRANSARNPRRTAITAAALMIGIALVTGISVVFTSAKQSIAQQVESTVQAQLVVAGQQTSALPPTFPAADVPKIEAVPGVAKVAAISVDLGKVNDKQQALQSVNSVSALAAIFGLKATEGSLGELQPGQLIVDSKTASDADLKLGSTVTVDPGRGDTKPYSIAAIYKKTDTYSGYVLAPAAAADFRTAAPAQAWIQVAPGASVSAVKSQVDTILADSPLVSVSDRSEYVKQQTSIFDTILLMVQILLALAIIIAVLGIINTLALSVLERTRELGLLRAIGLGRGQTMRMITVESVVISVFGALLGLVVGSALGAAAVRALRNDGFSKLAFPWGQMVAYLVLAAVIGVIAALLPAIRAARLNVLNAISYE